jgi:IS30 family transposase
MTYHQITLAERYPMASLRAVGAHPAAIARELGRHLSTILRELRPNRNAEHRYRPYPAQTQALARRSVSRCNRRLAVADWWRVVRSLRAGWSLEQIAGWGRRTGVVRISHETIYRYVAYDRHAGGTLYRCLRGARKRCRRRPCAPSRRTMGARSAAGGTRVGSCVVPW